MSNENPDDLQVPARCVRLDSSVRLLLVGALMASALSTSGCSPAKPDSWRCGLEAPECVDLSNERICDGAQIVTNPCGGNRVCVDGEGCVTQICDPEQTPTCVDSDTERVCVEPGASYEEVDCDPGVECREGQGCEPPVCEPGDTICLSPDQIGVCNADQTDYEPDILCSEQGWGLVCINGECASRCEIIQAGDSSLGTEYYAVDLPQYNTDKDYGIIVSNTSEDATAHVVISTEAGDVATLEVPPMGLRVYSVLPRPQNIGVPGVFARAYRITSDLPVAAFQFNSLTTVDAASTDASLLFNTEVLAKKYWVMDYDGFNPGNFVAVYATEPDTTVELTPSQPVAGSSSGSLHTFGPTAAGQTLTVTLSPFEVLVVMAQDSGVSLTGTKVEGSAPIGVFGGNSCTQVPLGMSFCDHIEQQIFPRQAIGERYLVAKTHERTSCDPPDYIRVLADQDGTEITLDPPVAGPFSLNAGEWEEFPINESVEITATKPLLVGQFLRSSNGSECDDEGDPAFVLQVPVQQYRCSYVFLTPDTYDTDYINIVAPVGAQVRLDGVQVPLSTAPVGSGDFTVTSLVVGDGPHVLEGDDLVGVMVYGYGGPGSINPDTQNVSYAYPAGLSLQPINPVE
jgi:hypothetical protein